MISFYVLHDVINSLDIKYKENFNSFDRNFFCANYIKLLGMYNIFSLKQNQFNLRDKIESSKIDDVVEFFVNESMVDADKSILLLGYSTIINKVINDVTKPYFSSLVGAKSDLKTQKKKQKFLRILSYNLRDIFVDKNNYYKKVPSTYTANQIELETIIKLFDDVFQLSNTKNIILKSQENLQKYYNQNINFLFFKKIKYSYLDKRRKSKFILRPCLKTGLYSKKIDYLNMNKREWLNPFTDKYETSSFIDIYNEIVSESLKAINEFNLQVFDNYKITSVFKKYEFVVANPKLENSIFSKLTKFKK